MKTVMKFGGSSLATASRVAKVCTIIQDKQTVEGEAPIVVVSAVGGITDALIEAAQQAAQSGIDREAFCQTIQHIHADIFSPVWNLGEVRAFASDLLRELDDLLHGIELVHQASERTLDRVVSLGERFSAFLLARLLSQKGLPAAYSDARGYIYTDLRHGGARILFSQTETAIRRNLDAGLTIVTGFIASTLDGVTTNLGRGGSDYSAALIGAALDAEKIEIWTDVDGFMSADPRVVDTAFVLPQISMDEALELSYFGAKVIHPQTLIPAVKKSIPVWIKNSFAPEKTGTLIVREAIENPHPVRGLSSIDRIALINIQGGGMVGVPGIAQRVFGCLAKNEISVIMISQASSEHSICFAVTCEQAATARHALQQEFTAELQLGLVDCIELVENQTIIAIVGEFMRGTPGISGKLFGALGRHRINVTAIAQGSSERNISLIVDQADSRNAIRTIHRSFFSTAPVANLYLVGLGRIGATLLQQINALDKQKYTLSICGIAEQQKMLIAHKPIDIGRWQDELIYSGVTTDLRQFAVAILESNQENRIFVDCTASEETVQLYPELLARGIHIVTPNKRANTAPLTLYRQIAPAAKQGKCRYLYETTVGAALPVISSLRDLIANGDTVVRIEGILSGTLNYLFAGLDGKQPLSAILHQAHEKGYTEPDPRDDLSGLDVARKLLILARELGHPWEIGDIQIEALLPPEWFDWDRQEFWRRLPELDESFEKKRRSAAETNRVLRYVAVLEPDGASVALRQVETASDLALCRGTDNLVHFYSRRYQPSPLTVKGPGAGPEVTAGGVLADILRICADVDL
ncbi:bifunctional aspartate kinase/homoserine dehydrogenase I [candidate division KSB1 bacterium]|nr:bifunctional aspartate kinase/homoserine dehydrogenase I [candidate division KSB1 bacterium]